jgi:tetratricopeptide (TPR) repeat protein
MAPDIPKYWAFISYSHADKAWADWLHRALERYRIPGRLVGVATAAGPVPPRIAPVFLDRVELAASTDLDATIGDALRSCRSLIVICSPAAVGSPRVTQEIESFRALKSGRILPVIVAGRPNATERGGDPLEECFPLPLRGAQLDGQRQSPVPLAADVRSGKGGRQEALLKLISGILNLNLDQLRQRDLQRRRRRWAAATAMGLTGMVCASALAAYAWIERNAAVHAETRAITEATTSKATVEFLTTIFDAPTPEASLGRPITARELLDAGAQRLTSALATAPEVRARLSARMGRAYRQIGEYDRAAPLLTSALAQYAALPNATFADKAETLTDLALLDDATDHRENALEKLRNAMALETQVPSEQRSAMPSLVYGDIKTKAADFATAKAALDNASIILANRRQTEDRENYLLLRHYSRLYFEQGKFAEAEQFGLRALATQERVLGASDSSAVLTLHNLQMVYVELGDLPKAEDYGKRAVALAEKIFGQNHPMYTNAVESQADVLGSMGKSAEAEKLMRPILEIRLRTLGPEHTSTGYAYYNLGNAIADQGRLTEALPLIRRSQEIWEVSEGHDHPDVAWALDLQAWLLTNLNRSEEALPLAKRSLAISEQAYGPIHPNVARALTRLGEAYIAQRNYTSAVTVLERALQINQSSYGESNEKVAACLETYAKALTGAGRSTDAQAARARATKILALNNKAGHEKSFYAR